MKRLLLLMILFVSFAAANPADINDYFSLNNIPLEIEYEASASGSTSYDMTANVLTIGSTEPILKLDISSFTEDFDYQNNDYGYSKVVVSNGDGPKLTFCRDIGSDCLEIASIEAETGNTLVSMSKLDPDTAESVCYIVEHDRGEPFLDLVCNKKANLKVNNNGIMVYIRDQTTLLSIESFLSSFLGMMIGHREIDVLHNSVMEMFIEQASLTIKEYSYTNDPAADRHFEETGSPNDVFFTPSLDRWQELTVDPMDCESMNSCGVRPDGEDYCYCTRYGNVWSWRKQGTSGPEVCSGSTTIVQEGEDVPIDCCIGSCTITTCNKFGFFTLRQNELNAVREFTGQGGWILRTFSTTGILWDGMPNSDLNGASDFVSSAISMGLNPVVRLLNAEYDIDQTPESDSYIQFINQLYSLVSAELGDADLIVQIGTDPNHYDGPGDVRFDATEYAQMIVDISNGINPTIRDSISLVNAEIRTWPDGDMEDPAAYSSELFSVPGFTDSIQIFGASVYPAWVESPIDLQSYNDFITGKPVLLTSVGIGLEEFGDPLVCPDPNTIQSGALAAFNTWVQDPNVVGVMIFLLLDTEYDRECISWVGVDASGAISSNSTQYDALKAGSQFREAMPQSVCAYNIGLHQNIELTPDVYPVCTNGQFTDADSIDVTIARDVREAGNSECYWKAVYRPLTCSEMSSLGYGKVFARILNSGGSPVSALSIKYDETLQSTRILEAYPECQSEPQTIAGAGYVMYDVVQGRMEPFNPSTNYDYVETDVVIFNEPSQINCGGQMKDSSYSVRFYQVC